MSTRVPRPLAAAILAALVLVACAEPVAIPVPDDLAGTSDARLVEAVRSAREALEAAPDSALAWARLGHVYLAHKWDHDAAECYRRAIELEPDAFGWQYYLGRALFTIDDQQAADAFARAIELGQGYPPAVFYHGKVLSGLGRFDEARREFERLLEVDPDQPHARLALGELALVGRRLDEAREHLERAVAAVPEFSEAHASLAKLSLALGDSAAAARHADLARRPSRVPALTDPLWRAVQMMSAAPEGFFARANFYFEAGQLERGLEEMEKVVAAGQDDPEVWLYYASVMLDRGRYERTVAAIERVLELSGAAGHRLAPHKIVSAHIMAGAAYARLSDAGAARAHLVRAIELDPTSRAAADELALLGGP